MDLIGDCLLCILRGTVRIGAIDFAHLLVDGAEQLLRHLVRRTYRLGPLLERDFVLKMGKLSV